MPSRTFQLPPPLTPPFVPEELTTRRPPMLMAPVRQEPVLPPSEPFDLPPAPAGAASPKRDALAQFDEIQARRPKPLTGLRRVGMSYLEGGIPGALGALIDRQGPQREQYADDMAELKTRTGLEHQQRQDETNETYRQSLIEDARDRAVNRGAADRDRDEAREAGYARDGWTPIQPGEMAESPEDGKPSGYDYAEVGGKQRKRRSAYGQAVDKKTADEANYRAVPDAIADALKLPRGMRVPPNELDSYLRAYNDAQPKPGAPRNVSRGGTLVGPDGKVIYQDSRPPASSGGGRDEVTQNSFRVIESRKQEALARAEDRARRRIDGDSTLDSNTVWADLESEKKRIQAAYEAEIAAANGAPSAPTQPPALPRPGGGAAPAQPQKTVSRAAIIARAQREGIDPNAAVEAAKRLGVTVTD